MAVNSAEIQHRKNEAISQYSNGYLMDARQSCEEICKLDPSDADALCLLGMIYGRLNQFSDSIECLRKAIEVSPEFVDAHYNLAISLHHLGGHEEAGEELEYVITKRADDVDAHCTLGLIKMACGEYQQALVCNRTARSIDPGNMKAIAGEAEVYEKLGEIERASEIIQPYASHGLKDPYIATIYGKLARRLGNYHEAIDQLEEYLGKSEIDPEEELQIRFILGSLCDNDGNFDAAFHHYREGNELRGLYFDSYRFQYEIDQLIDRFSIVKFDKYARSSCQSELPLFIIGMPRSGTSLVEQVLASHKDVYGAGELDDINRLVKSLSIGKRVGYYELEYSSILTTRRLDEASNDYLRQLHTLSPTVRRITDKMLVNYRYLGYIALMFPNARVIHCKRNAIDTCLSCYFQNFSSIHDYAFNLEDIGRYYLGYRRLMEHWQQVLPMQIHEVVYENLVENPEREIRKLVEFSGLEWDDQCLRHYENRRLISTASYNQVRKPIYRNSVKRWRNYEKHIGPLLRILGEQA